MSSLSAQSLEEIFGDVTHFSLSRTALAGEGLPLTDLLAHEGVALPSKSEARRKLKENAVSLNDVKTSDEQRRVGPGDLLHGRFIILRVGKKNYTLVELTP